LAAVATKEVSGVEPCGTLLLCFGFHKSLPVEREEETGDACGG